ncbi:UbiD family decarboxylase [Chloroflexota bacterium]
MLFKDFRDYLDKLESAGLLVRVKKEVSHRFEISAGLRKISDNDGPALLFENVSGYPGWRVIGGLFATQRLLAFALQAENREDKLQERYLEFDQKSVEPIEVSSGPVKEVIINGNEVDLTKLPVPIYCEHDNGPYLTAGVEMLRHPTTGEQNAAIYRRQILDKNTTTLWMPPAGTIAGHSTLIMQATEELGKPAGIATVLGVHPAITIASQIKAPFGLDEVSIAGAINGKAVEVVKCETIDVHVPADAEIVIEGIIQPGETLNDGPFGEFPGNYITLGGKYLTSSGKMETMANVVKVTAITMRKDAIFEAMLTGMPTTENHVLRKWAWEAALYRVVVQQVPYLDDIRGINVTMPSTNHHAIISIKKRTESLPRELIYSILTSAKGMLVGRIVIVDDDIDVYNPSEVEWAIATRVKPDRDVIIIPPVPPAPESIITSPLMAHRWGIDATAPLTKEPWAYKRAVPPGVDNVDYV